MTINLRRNWRPAFAAIAAAGSLGLLHCNVAKQDAPPAPATNEPAPQQPTAVGGGPRAAPATPDMTKEEPGTARGISALEQYLDGKGTDANRFALDGLTYEYACPYLTQKGVDSVDTLADLLIKHPGAKVSIESFTDNTGSDEANKYLSKRRAEVVKKQLVLCGIDSKRIEVVARGEEKPIASNQTDDGKAQNRLTEIIVHK